MADESKRTLYAVLYLQDKYYISRLPPDASLACIKVACSVDPANVHSVLKPLTCVVTNDRWDRTAPLVPDSRPLFYCSEGAYGSFRVFQADSADALADCLTDNLDGQYSLGRPDPAHIPTVKFVDNVADLITHEMVAAANAFQVAKKAMDSARDWFAESTVTAGRKLKAVS